VMIGVFVCARFVVAIKKDLFTGPFLF